MSANDPKRTYGSPALGWLLYLPAIILAVIGAVALTPGWIIAAVSFFAALMFALRAWLIRRMTEFVVTDRRVIYRRGPAKHLRIAQWCLNNRMVTPLRYVALG
jgi:hypothetical protein